MRALVPSWEALQGQSCGVNEYMRPYCGQVGVMSDVGGGICRLTFPDGDYWGYDLDRLLHPPEVPKVWGCP